MRDRDKPMLPNWLVGIAMIALTALGTLLAFAGELPWSRGHELNAVFPRVQGLNPASPVRVAGVDVGKVTEIRHLDAAPGSGEGSAATARGGEGSPRAGASVVTMELTDEALPVHTDATLRIRPRLFLEGNYFIDLEPGSPAAPEAADGETIPLTATSAPVQLDEVLTTLQADVRRSLRTSLAELAGALIEHGGEKGLRELTRTAGGAARHTAVVNEALLGTRPGDLSGVIRNLGRVAAALDRNEPQLQALVTDLNAVAGALAAEGTALETTIAELPETIDAAGPTLDALNASLPGARAFAREALPGVRALPPAIDAATPLLRETRGLLGPDELGGVVRDLRSAVPRLVALTRRSTGLLGQARALSSCFNEIVVPWSRMTVPDPENPATGEVHEETSYGLVGISGESRSFDSNGPYIRALGSQGTNTVVYPPVDDADEEMVGLAPLPILGARPSLESSAKTPLRRDVACETNDPPELDSGQAAPPPDQQRVDASSGTVEPTSALRSQVRSVAERLEHAKDLAGGNGPRAARRAKRLQAGALADLESALADALGWQHLLEEVRP